MTKVLYDQSKKSTRSYDTTNGQRLAVGATAVLSAAIEGIEVLLHASVKCYVATGVTPAATASGGGIPLEAGEKFHLQLNNGEKVSVIQDAAGGFLHIIPCN